MGYPYPYPYPYPYRLGGELGVRDLDEITWWHEGARRGILAPEHLELVEDELVDLIRGRVRVRARARVKVRLS